MIQSKLLEFLDTPTPLFHPEAKKDKTEGQVIYYSGKKYLSTILTGDNIVAKNDGRLTAILEYALSSCQEIPFMAIDHEGSSEKINGKYHYILRLYGSFINCQKVIVTLSNIPVFFDILISDKKSSDDCETKVRYILSDEVKTLKIEHIKAFPFHSYYTKKKTYLGIYTSGTDKRKIAIKAIQENNFETASDDLYSFHRKVAGENEIQLSGGSIFSKYKYKKGIDPLYPYLFYTSKKYFRSVKDFKTISNRFPISAFLRDHTFVLTGDIEI